MEVGIEGRDDSEDDYDDEEFDENDEFESAHPAIPSADAFGKDDFYEKGTEKTTRKMKRDERNEIRKLEELDAKERRQQLHSLLETDLPQSERLVYQLQLQECKIVILAIVTTRTRMKRLKKKILVTKMMMKKLNY